MSSTAAIPRVPDLSGLALDGRYELHAVIGEGTFGRVYRGHDRRLARPVAIKVIKPWWTEDPNWVRRFEREAQLTARVSDPHIVQIFDVGHAEEGLYYVAELVDGASVAARLRDGPLPAWEACDIAEQLSRALGSAHAQRVVHGDIKPANVLISSRGSVKITDFGMARLLSGTSGEVTGTIAGTPAYMAPEQARGRGTTPATDVYSIGVVLYEMLVGHPPFRGESPVELALRHLQDQPPPLPSTTPPPLRDVVERALAKQPDRRYSDGIEMADALARSRGSSSPTATADGSRAAPGSRASSPNGVARTLVAPWWSPRRNVSLAARRRSIGLFSLVLALILGMVAAAILTAGGARVRVPNLRGLTRDAISAKLVRAHLAFTARSHYSSAPRGTAIAQTPGPGAQIDEGARVTATLSAGPPPVAVPGIVGFSSGDAESSLRQLGLKANVNEVPAPGATVGTVAGQTPSAGVKLLPGSTVSLSVAEAPQWRAVVGFTDRDGRASPSFRIRGTHWRIVYRMAYSGTCTFIFFCSGPSAEVTKSGGGTVGGFDLNDGDHQVQTFSAGPGVYQIRVKPGSDSATWSAEVQDYY
jgi:eukaryotic-like serine/threonine-protein kinase